MKQPKKPTLDQKKMIQRAGLDPGNWCVMKENRQYLYLVDRGMERCETAIIDKATLEVMQEKSPEPTKAIRA